MRASLIGLLVLTAAAGAVSAQVVRSASGANGAAIQGAIDAFRGDLGGGLNANVTGSFGAGRREINWDGVPDQFDSPNALPANFFNVNSPRGVVFSTPGTGFQNSSSAASGTPVRFGNINAAYTNEFAAFSGQRLFTAIGSPTTDVDFFIPGSTTATTTRGFGVVFTDVDVTGSARIELFNGAASLGSFDAPAFAGDGGFSFIGVSYTDANVTRVRITSGTSALGGLENLPGTDLVVMDDFIYGEPVPTPGALCLAGVSLIAAARRPRR
jgi:type II secretory pathway pseudopilin PulG